MTCAHCKATGPDVFPVDGDHAVCADCLDKLLVAHGAEPLAELERRFEAACRADSERGA